MLRVPVLVGLLAGIACDRVFQLTEVSDVGDLRDADTDGGATFCFGDTFDSTAIDESKWEISDAAPTATVVQSGGQAVFNMGIGSGNNYAQLRSATRDLTHDSVALEVVQAPNGLTQAEAGFSLRIDTAHRYEMFVTANKVDMRWTNGGSNDDMKIPFDDTTRFWRIRNDGTMVLYETSTTGETWVARRSVQVMVPFNALKIALYGGTFQEEPTSPGSAIFDNLRVDCAP